MPTAGPDFIAGFVPGIVTNIDDPEGTGRIKVRIPGLFDEPEAPYWIMPAGWPGAGKVGRGSQYPPPPINAHVYIMFEYGVWKSPDAHAVYLTGYYGILEDTNVQAGPEIISDAPTAERAHQRVVLWEGDSLIAYIIEDEDEERLIMQAKATGSKIEINAKDGTGGKSETIYIEARTMLSLYSKGLLDIKSDSRVQIQGRIVDSGTGRGI